MPVPRHGSLLQALALLQPAPLRGYPWRNRRPYSAGYACEYPGGNSDVGATAFVDNGPGDFFLMPAGHHAWIVGDQRRVMTEFAGVAKDAETS